MAFGIPPGPGFVADLTEPVLTDEAALMGLRELHSLETLNRVLGGMLFRVVEVTIPEAQSDRDLLKAQAKVEVIRELRAVLQGLTIPPEENQQPNG